MGHINKEERKVLDEWRADPFGWGEKHGFPRVDDSLQKKYLKQVKEMEDKGREFMNDPKNHEIIDMQFK